MLRIGLLGAGYLGKIHLRCIKMATDHYHLVGFYDPDPAIATAVAAEYGVVAFPTVAALIDAVDVVDVVTPTVTHFALAQQVLEAGRHLFIEKPLTHTLSEAEALVRLSHERQLKVQVGHVERFNPALLALDDQPLAPMFIEAHRLANFNPRGTDVSVVLDLMIHDIDIVLSMVDSEVAEVRASGVAVLSDAPDIANARIEFANGCVANLTASRMSLKQMRKVRLFQRDAYISIDLLEKQAQVVRLLNPPADGVRPSGQFFELSTPAGERLIHIDLPPIEPVNAIRLELETFAESIQQNTRPRVNAEDGYRALALAHRVMDEMKKHQSHTLARD